MSRLFMLPCLAFAACLGSAAIAGEPATTEAERIGFDKLSNGRNMAAIREIKANETLARDDPARNINLGIAYAREGYAEEAQAYFRAALSSEERADLQTAEGEWIDSRQLAREGLRKLASGEFEQASLAALR